MNVGVNYMREHMPSDARIHYALLDGGGGGDTYEVSGHDPSNPDSATSQFFINVKDNDFLDQGDGYAVFGKVVKGMDVVDIIVNSPTTTKQGMQNVPSDPVIIKSAKVID